MFETFLANKYTAAKRFGLEGAESLIPGMKFMIDTSAELGVQSVVMGMPHRGVSSNHASEWYEAGIWAVFSKLAGMFQQYSSFSLAHIIRCPAW